MNHLYQSTMKQNRAIFLSLSLLLLAGCYRPQMVAKETRNVTAAVVSSAIVEIESKNGSINIVCQPNLTEAQIEATIVCRAETQELADERLSKTELVVEQSGETLKIYPKFPEPQTNEEGASIKLLIPSVSAAVSKTSNGAIDVDGSLNPIMGAIEAKTSNAQVNIQSAQSVNADSSNGSMTLKKIAGPVVAQTTNASITLHDIAGSIDVKSSNGEIATTLIEGQQGPIQARTSNNSVQLNVAADFSGRVAVDTSNAKVSIQDPSSRVTENSVKKTSGVIAIGESDSNSQLVTSNGTISLSIAPNPQ